MDPSYAYSFGWGECPDYAPMSDEQWKARERAAFAWEIDGSSQGCWVSPECLQHYPTMPVPSGSADSAWSGSSISCPLDSGTGTSCSHAQVAAQCTDYHLLVTDFPDVSSSLQQAPQQPMAFPPSSSQQPSTQTPMLQLTTPSRTAHLPPLDTSSTSTLSPSTFCPAEHSPERTTPTEEDVDGQTIRVQQPRFEADLYTARWVRGEGTGRAGWCGFCSTWHKLKDSAFWYHMHYTHGISYVTGRPLEGPRKVARGTKTSQVLCGRCNRWIEVGHQTERARTTYFRHAHKCHTTQDALHKTSR
ncbi:hypothetical protein BDY17DRAFT_321400 [Neohortaea acidophila]|uniref:Transcription regulator Rua1 C-terminal domain-containing protein n=1 Tax=Neohortaea acidophila TaxID=245834 RepID=A0A6A6Q4N6_9PEZI|nr:uncharacterized protein BDY17DRAFT_321400 [Neohortaea acidophila]KAF2486623.1 hypothetical protein BDY17DRAFT_321400 [Neohortaea acidophila]